MFSGKLPLSNEAIKAAAASLVMTGKMSPRARADYTISAGLRADIPYPLEVALTGDEAGYHSTKSPITWIFGSTGSGAGEAMRHWASNSLAAGRTPILIDYGGTSERVFQHPYKEYSAPVAMALSGKSEVSVAISDTASSCERLPEGFFSKGSAFLLVVCALNASPEQASHRTRDAIDALPRGPQGLASHVLFIDNPPLDDLCEHIMPLIEEVRSGSRVSFSQIVIRSRADQLGGAVGEMINPKDEVVWMRLPGIAALDAPSAEALLSLREGDAFIRKGSDWRIAVFPYLNDSEAIMRLEPARRAKSILSSAIAREATLSHVKGLEAISRACGYRSWHAAQGRGATARPDITNLIRSGQQGERD